MKKVGITGQNGFIGYHLTQTLRLQKTEFEIIPFSRDNFNNPKDLDDFVKKCDVIVHLAALNRHHAPEEIFQVNRKLTDALIESLNRTGCTPHVLISSSTQEARENIYGQSKKYARESLASWAMKAGAKFTGLVIPNVFGPFGVPFYNSVVATFCHQLARDEEPKIDVDAVMQLIYVGELVDEIIECISHGQHDQELYVKWTAQARVSEILNILKRYKTIYQDKGRIPKFNTSFEEHLFNTFRCYIPISDYFPRRFTKHCDDRGCFVELMRANGPGQTSFSTTKSGVTRGEHFHTRKIERFAVIQGEACIQLRRIGTQEIIEFELSGEQPSYVDMPIWHTHNITNIGEDDLITVFWINEAYNPDDPDTWFEKVKILI